MFLWFLQVESFHCFFLRTTLTLAYVVLQNGKIRALMGSKNFIYNLACTSQKAWTKIIQDIAKLYAFHANARRHTNEYDYLKICLLWQK